MVKLNFTVDINAPKEKVWKTLWEDQSYRQWTSVFMEGSHAKSDWQEGSKIEFLTPKGDGMFSTIHKKVDNSQMVFKHLGEIKDGVETISDWGEVYESYFLTEKNAGTELRVELDTTEDFQQYFHDTFPKAMALVKQLAEK
jgi:uncharacterized protein YndB with AHSA1/START domain